MSNQVRYAGTVDEWMDATLTYNNTNHGLHSSWRAALEARSQGDSGPYDSFLQKHAELLPEPFRPKVA